MRQKFDAAAAGRIGGAVRELESRSAAELVVDIRARSGTYAHADARFAALLTIVSLVVLIYMPLVVPPVMVLFDAIAVYVLGIAIARRSTSVRRLFTSERERLAAVSTYAAAAFHERGLANTAEESGVLLYVSLLERRIEVLADRGVLRSVSATDWNATVDLLRTDRDLDADAVVTAVRALDAILSRALPAGATNEDELSNAPELGLA